MTSPARVTLIVDDDPAFCAALAFALRKRGEKAVIAHTAIEAKSEALAWRPSRATIDLRLRESSGLDLVRELRELLPELEMVVLTGYGSIATAVSAVKAGALHYLTKPARVEEILSAFDGEMVAQEEPGTLSLDEIEWEHLQKVLTECGGNVSEAARRLGMHRRTLQRKLARYR